MIECSLIVVKSMIVSDRDEASETDDECIENEQERHINDECENDEDAEED
jgi:hypothetical protein